ncbi:hypothetical protein SH661x_001458 [Planctomicrobium sp. SH661]|uniref:GAP1-N2 domain-containing protein n=1 Tax=Planctomicrobium sp. SH661 TaxID=3448124 RepID=UPI003F5B5296
MIQELLYTSAPKGLKPGSRGFCTVLSTSGMPAPVATALESLSGYRPVFPPGDPQASQNPVVYSHLQMSLSGRRSSVLSRIADYGLDYSQRTNKLAHHLVLDPADRPSAGPAWTLAQSGMIRDQWDGELKVVSGERRLPQGKTAVAKCTAWEELTGDAGWAGVLAESFLKHPEQPAYIIFSPGMNLLPLMEEAISLLPASRRWDVTFSTYFTKIPNGVTCNWRCLLADSPEAVESRRYVQSLRIDLTKPLPPAKGGPLVSAARTGVLPTKNHLEEGETASPHVFPPRTSEDDPDEPIRLVHERALPPSIRGQAAAPPIHQAKSRSRKLVKRVAALILLATIAAGAGFYLTGLKSWMRSLIATATPIENETSSAPSIPENQRKTTTTGSSSSSTATEEDQKTNSEMGLNELSNGEVLSEPAATVSIAPPHGGSLMPENPGVVAETSLNSTPAAAMAPEEQPADSPPSSRSPNLFYFWADLVKDLEPNVPQQLAIDKVVIEEVKVWSPTDLSNNVRAKQNEVFQDFQKSDSWSPYLKVSSSLDDQDGAKIAINVSARIPYQNHCRFIYTIKTQGCNDLATILPYAIVQYIDPQGRDTKNRRHKLIFPTNMSSASENWNLSLNSLKLTQSAGNILPDDKPVPLIWNGNVASGDFNASALNLLDPSSQLFDNPLLESMKDQPVPIKLSVANSPEIPSGQKNTEVIVEFAFYSFETSLKKFIEHDLDEAIKFSPMGAGINAKWLSATNRIVSDGLLSEVQQASQQAEAIKRSNTVTEKEDGMYTQEELNKMSISNSAGQQLARLGRIKQFCEFATQLITELKSLHLKEVIISQECKNDNVTKFLPIFVYPTSEQASQAAK